jgi:hypothetical protein
METDSIQVDIERLPEHLKSLVSVETPTDKRLLAAKALIPMAPDELLTLLAALSNDKSEAVASAARQSIKAVPSTLVASAAPAIKDAGVLDTLCKLFIDDHEIVSRILSNPATKDQTFLFVARRGQGVCLEQVAQNQVRIQRTPAIVEALYYNKMARLGLVSGVLEFAVRAGLDLSHIPGYLEIVESIFGKEVAERIRKEKAPVPEVKQQVEPPEIPDLQKAVEAEIASQEGLSLEGQVFDDAGFAMLLEAAAWEEGREEEEEDERGEEKRRAAWAQVQKLTIPEKVRMALLGNEFVRSVLIKDSRRVVYMAVLKSPALSEKEVTSFAKDKALNEEIVRLIASNRDWTKLYAIRHALVQNPKCPPAIAQNFLKTLTPRDLKLLSLSHDVPGYIARQAKQLVQARETGQMKV